MKTNDNKTNLRQIITYKDVMESTGLSKCTSEKILTQIRKEAEIKRVTRMHLDNYLGIRHFDKITN